MSKATLKLRKRFITWRPYATDLFFFFLEDGEKLNIFIKTRDPPLPQNNPYNAFVGNKELFSSPREVAGKP